MKKQLLLILPLLLLGVQLTFAQGIDASKFLMFNKFDNNLTDESTVGVTLTPQGEASASYVAGKFGSALNFDASCFLTSGSQFNPEGDFSLCAWIKMDQLTADLGHSHTWIHQLDGGGAAGRIHLEILNSVDAIGTFTDGVRCDDSAHAITAATWYHVASVKSTTAGERYLYVNGELMKTQAIATNESSTAELAIGTRKNLSAAPADGAMDELLITSQVLSKDIITEIMNKGVTQAVADNPIVGFNQTKTNISLDIYPNPSNGSITIRTEQPLTNTAYQVSDLTGKTIQSGLYSTGETIDLNNLAKGVYFIAIEVNNQQTTEKIIIK